MLLFGPAAELGDAGPGIEVIDAPLSIAKEANPAAAARANPESSIVRAAQAVAGGRRRRARLGGRDRRRARRRPVQHQARPRHPAPRARRAAAGPGRAGHARSTSAPTPRCAPSTSSSSPSWARRSRRSCTASTNPRVALLSVGEEATRGTPLTIDVHARLTAARGLNFVGNIEGHALVEGSADVVVTDGFTGNVTLKVMEGVSDKMIALLQRDRDLQRAARRPAACSCARRCARFATRSRPRSPAAPTCSGLRKIGVVGHGRFTSRGFAHAILLAARGVTGDVVGRTHDALERAGALRKPGAGAVRERLYRVRAMTRDEVFAMVQAHLVDELEVDPARIDDSTNFRVDLEADSLDLYTLVQELEDSYGVKMTDEQAAKIVTVGQAVDFVLAHAAVHEPSES